MCYNIPVESLIKLWQNEPSIKEQIAVWQVDLAREAVFTSFPANMDPRLAGAVRSMGILNLFIHQKLAWEAVQRRENIVVVTSTASGKTFCYNLPVLNDILTIPKCSALYLYPTRALASDQKNALSNLVGYMEGAKVPLAVYDGDTTAAERQAIRKTARLLLTNPDMLHIGILPHHTQWVDFFRNLRYVVLDEVHTYRGVFGSHVANVLRRLKRITSFYGVNPLFIMTSATIANPGDHASRLIGDDVTVIDQDGSPKGMRHFLIYNPPIIDQKLGIRLSAGGESVRLAGDLLHYRIQTIIFGQSRRTVEILLTSLRTQHPGSGYQLRGYRSGYLPQERREVEQGLRSGSIDMVVATNALELGVDIGGMGAVVLVGYPGTIAATRQQAGRAGRRMGTSMAVMVASGNPIDQYLVKHPEYLLGNSPEKALINPDNLLILLNHVRCASFELPFKKGDGFGTVSAELLEGLLQILMDDGILHFAGGRYFWTADQYPAVDISLRSISGGPVLLQIDQNGKLTTIGEVDRESAVWMVHPEAIYMHEGQSYCVEALDLEHSTAILSPVSVDYFTESRKRVAIEKVETYEEQPVPGGKICYGEILVTSEVIGYRRIDWATRRILGEGAVQLPPVSLQTTAYWIMLDEKTIEHLRDKDAWSNDPNKYGPNWKTQRDNARLRDHYTCQACGITEQGQSHQVHHIQPFRTFDSPLEANALENLVTLCPACHRKAELGVKMRSGLSGLGYVLHNLSSLFLMCDASDLDFNADSQSPLSEGQPTVVIFEQTPGGIGLAENIYQQHATLVREAQQMVMECDCEEGCPACVGPAGENGIGGKSETLALLAILNGEGSDHA